MQQVSLIFGAQLSRPSVAYVLSPGAQWEMLQTCLSRRLVTVHGNDTRIIQRRIDWLYKVKNPRCDGLDADEQVLSGYMQMDVQYCQVGDDQLRNDLLNETGDNFDFDFCQYIFSF